MRKAHNFLTIKCHYPKVAHSEKLKIGIFDSPSHYGVVLGQCSEVNKGEESLVGECYHCSGHKAWVLNIHGQDLVTLGREIADFGSKREQGLTI